MHIIPIENREQWLELRRKAIGASEAAALFACSPFETEFSLWFKKFHGVDSEESEPMLIGRHVEEGIAKAAEEKYDFKLYKADKYYFDDENHLGATPDYVDGMGNPVEIKNVSGFAADKWVDGVPLHYRVQLQVQMGLMNKPTATLIALHAGSRLEKYVEEFNTQFFLKILDKSLALWQRVESGDAPTPGSDKDYSLLTSVLENDGETADMTNSDEFTELAEELEEVTQRKKALAQVEKDEKIVKARMLALMGAASVAVASNGIKIKRTVINEAEIPATIRKGYTRVTVTFPKAENE